MILVTGATGTIGSEVLRRLVARGIPVRGMSRNPQHSGLVRGDFEDPESLRKATDGVEAVFLLSAPGPWIPDHDRAMVEAAVDSRVRKIVKLSAVGSAEAGTPANWHAAGERAVRESVPAWTILRPTGFMSNILRWLPAVRAGQPIPNQTGLGRHAVVDPGDVAAVAVEALTSAAHDGRIYTPTGPDLLNVPDQVAQLSEVLGRQLETVDISLDDFAQQLRAVQLDEATIAVALRGAALVRDGGALTMTGDVGQVLGHPARSFRSWAERNRAAFE